jgi:hypothetical protein
MNPDVAANANDEFACGVIDHEIAIAQAAHERLDGTHIRKTRQGADVIACCLVSPGQINHHYLPSTVIFIAQH